MKASICGVGKLHKYDEQGRAIIHFTGEGARTIAPKTPIVRVRLNPETSVRFKTAEGTVAIGEVIDFLSKREDGGFVYRVAAAERADTLLHSPLRRQAIA